MSPNDIGLDERIGAENTTIDMTLSSEIDYSVDIEISKEVLNQPFITDIASMELPIRKIGNRRTITRICKAINHMHRVFWMPVTPEMHKVAANEASTTSYE